MSKSSRRLFKKCGKKLEAAFFELRTRVGTSLDLLNSSRAKTRPKKLGRARACRPNSHTYFRQVISELNHFYLAAFSHRFITFVLNDPRLADLEVKLKQA